MTDPTYPDSIDAAHNAETQRKADKAPTPAPFAPITDARFAEMLAAFTRPQAIATDHPMTPLYWSVTELEQFTRRLAQAYVADVQGVDTATTDSIEDDD
jgi:hypothetical protein